MLQFYGVVLGLAVAGLDPIAAFIALGALAAGATRRAIVVFVVVTLVTPAVLGIALSRTLGTGFGDLDWSWLALDHPAWAVVEVAVAALLLVWGVRRWRAGDVPAVKERRARGTSTPALAGFGFLYGISYVTDPTYLATVVVAGRESLVPTIVAHVAWSALSQAPLVGVGLAVATGRHAAAVRVMTRLRTRFGPLVRRTVTVLLVGSGLLLAADVVTFVVTGDYLLG